MYPLRGRGSDENGTNRAMNSFANSRQRLELGTSSRRRQQRVHGRSDGRSGGDGHCRRLRRGGCRTASRIRRAAGAAIVLRVIGGPIRFVPAPLICQVEKVTPAKVSINVDRAQIAPNDSPDARERNVLKEPHVRRVASTSRKHPLLAN